MGALAMSGRLAKLSQRSGHQLLLLLVMVLASLRTPNAQTNYLQVLSTPQNCFGGQPCRMQPTLNVLKASGELDLGFVGYVSISLYTSPSSKTLYQGTCTNLDSSCASASTVVGTYGSAPFINGVAQFQNIMIKLAGTGYVLKFVGTAGNGGGDFAFAFSNPFDVYVGEPYRLQFATFIGAAFGGKPFSPNPAISVVDRGGNLVTTVNTGKISARLTTNPYPSETLRTLDSYQANFQNGIASFVSLYLNKAGGPYAISLDSDLVVYDGTTPRMLSIASKTFSVAIGQPSNLQFAPGTTISSAPVYAGEFFTVTPRLIILDAGGNVVLGDSSSGVQAAIYANPAQGVLGAPASLFSIANAGVITFSTLTIDRASNGYSLSFTLSTYSPRLGTFTPTSIVLLSEHFNVNIGPPRQLVSTVYGNYAWAGGQPMEVQPIVQVLDYGLNVISTDYSSTCVCSMVSSLSTSRKVTVDTTTTDSTFVKTVGINVPTGTYGAGQVLIVTLYFNFEVWVLTLRKPTLLLDFSAPGEGTPRHAEMTGSTTRTMSLTFRYQISMNDTSPAFDYASTSALQLNGATIVNGNNRTVSTLLPSRGIRRNATVVIDTSTPYIKSVRSSAAGIFSVGDVIVINVTFSTKVSVFGSPYILLTAVNATGSPRSAVYSGISNSAFSALFNYVVSVGDSSPDLSIAGSGIVLPSDGSSKILRYSDFPSTSVNVTWRGFMAATFLAMNSIVVDTDVPKLSVAYGVQSAGTAGKTLYAGDDVVLTIAFDKAVVVVGQPQLNLRIVSGGGTGIRTIGGASYVGISADNKILEFRYTVTQDGNATALDIVSGTNALVVPAKTSSIKRLSATPTVIANIDTSAVYASNSLRNLGIQLQGAAAYVIQASIQSTSRPASQTLYVGDYALIKLSFSSPVVFSCDPVLALSLNSTVARSATYSSGNLTDTILFKYTVQMGDYSNWGIRYRYAPNALCLQSGCPIVSSCTAFTVALNPSNPVNLQLPPYADDPRGVPLSSVNIARDTYNSYRGTLASLINASTPAGIYGAGNFVYFNVTFTDEVIVSQPNFLLLHLNTGRFATYSSGSKSREIQFVYPTTELDYVTQLYATTPAGSASPINCSVPCTIRNRLSRDAILTGVSVGQNTGIRLDASAPHITKVWTNKTASPYDGVYTVGEIIEIYVKFSAPIVVSSTDVRLALDVGVAERYATFYAFDNNFLTLQYIVAAGDNTPNLAYSGSTLFLNNGKGIIFRSSTSLITQANYTLPAPAPLIQGAGKIYINTVDVPKVLSVTAVSPSSEYQPGDTIVFKMTFSRYVVLNGRAVLHMNLGNHISLATYAGTNATNIVAMPPLPSSPTKVLYFQVPIQIGDFTATLEYTDSFAFFVGITDSGSAGTLLQASSTPTVICNIDLPAPGTPGSLSKSATLKVNGELPYMTNLGYATPNNQYGAGQEIRIQMNFSKSVVVTGSPYIVLQTGAFLRNAVYTRGSGTSSIYFSYVVQPGDASLALDYATNRAQLQSSVSSFHLNGGTILALSAVPTAAAEVHFNPPGGVLLGSASATSAGGQYNYLDLNIKQRGPDYMIRFSSSPAAAARTITTTQPIFVSFSNEFEVRPQEAQINDLIGSSVSISGNLAMLGAPASNRSVTCIQTVTTSGARVQPAPEIQVFGIIAQPQPAIQSFHTTAGVGETLGGFFKITYGSATSSIIQGPTKPIPADVSANMLQSLIMQAIPKLGSVTVNRETYIFCACENAFTWTLTFHDVNVGVIQPLVFTTTALTGAGATIVGPTKIQAPALVGGAFNLLGNGLRSRPVPFDASANQIATALADLDYTTIAVQAAPPVDASLARYWVVTFDVFRGTYEIPVLSSDASGLVGGNFTIWHKINRLGVHGPGGINGGFFLGWRGNTTAFLPFDAEAAEVKAALEALPVVQQVNVNRSAPSSVNGYVWTIEFITVSANSPRGYQIQPTANLEPIVPVNALNGTNVTITVAAVYGLQISTAAYGAARRGTFGSNAGAVYMFQQNGEAWDEVATLHGNDTKENDFFGSSVALKGSVAVVGAIGAANGGVFEKQEIFCRASSGHFRIKFRGYKTALILANVTRDELIAAMIAAPGDYPKLSAIPSLIIDDWGGGPLCNNRKAVITFLGPTQGALGYSVKDDANLELLTLTDISLQAAFPGRAILNVTELQVGSRRPNGLTALKETTGAAYIFRTACLTRTCVQTWTQEAQLFPPAPSGGDRYGAAVATTGTIVVVGAPGTRAEKGAGYVYEYCSTNSAMLWTLLQEVSYYNFASPALDHFGTTVAVDGGTIVIGAPGYEGSGAVFVYKRTGLECSGVQFVITQILTPNTLLFPLATGDMYGTSVALSGNLIAVGSPGRAAATIYFGRQVNAPEAETGAVYVFRRATLASEFLFSQSLQASNIRRQDRFGTSVAIDGSTIVASSVESFTGALNASKAIIEVKTMGAYNAIPVGATFRLMWKADNSSGTVSLAQTRDIKFDTTALEMAAIMEKDLGCRGLLVSRSEMDAYDNGFSWLITFAGDRDIVSPLYADTTLLTGTNATVAIQFINESPKALRGKAHVFLNTGASFVEEAFLVPFSSQPIDRCGSSVAISGNYALVGCPNRDYSVPNHNSGAATIYYLSLLHVAFSSPTYSVTEGNTFTMTIVRDVTTAASVDTMFYIETIDRNSQPRNQKFIQSLYGIADSQIGFAQTAMDVAMISGTAVARANYYGSTHNESSWILGMYDYRAVSDYVPVYDPRAYLVEYQNLTDIIVTNSDMILEVPDENVTIAIHAPGIWPSALGKLMSVLTIVDDGDGFVNGVNQYDKLYQYNAAAGAHIGSTVSINNDFGVLVAGCPDGFTTLADGSTVQTGVALIYRMVQGHYVQKYTLYSPAPTAGGRFGDAVIIRRGYENTTGIVAVGEPSQASVHIYISNDFGVSFAYDATIRSSDATLAQHRFGAQGTLGLDGNLLVVGAPGLEAIYISIRVNVNGVWSWQAPFLLRASDYDYDIMYDFVQMHRQNFGYSVAVSARSVAVGAPYADYGKLGTNLAETNWDTEGSDIFGFGRGQAYAFYSAPAAQIITLNAPSQLTGGTFRISYSHLGKNATTTQLPYSVTAANLATALEALPNINTVSVTSAAGILSDNSGYQYSWTVTFMVDWQTPGSLIPQWNGTHGNFGCPLCIQFTDYLPNQADQMKHAVSASITDMTQVQIMSASDKRSGARFGSSIALDGNQIVVGSVHASTVTSTSWDFEAGTLSGWGATGNAFDYQPTFGDNSFMRPVDPDPGHAVRKVSQHSNVKGNYYIGTYEQHPGNPIDYTTPDPTYPQGSYVGDAPVGTLTSDVFIVLGSQISFLVGGGCDIYTVYVELLVDGFSVAKETGKCSEKMEPASFNVSSYQNRAAQIRIVDASTIRWGHINVDQIEFDWDINGAVYVNTNSKPVVGGNLETPRSGVVYAFLRHITGSKNLCGNDKLQCTWTEEAKLMASDKRSNFFFGSSVAVADSAGVVAVGSPSSDARGFYREIPSVYPFQNVTGGDISSIPFPVASNNAGLFQSTATLTPEASGASGVWQMQASEHFPLDPRGSADSGAVYIFTKNHAKDTNGIVTISQHWANTEHAKIQSPDIYPRDNFGASVALDGNLLAISASGNDGIQPDAGALYVFQSGFSALYFAANEFPVLEGTDNVASITVARNLETFSGEIVVQYTTSDLTATGVDGYKFAACQNLATNLRGLAHCGDYQQSRGFLVIPAGSVSSGFKIPIMNDLCNERYPKYIQITLSVPGSAALQGESVSSRIRIDDDDFIQPLCYSSQGVVF